jgi:hypothetical protein
MALEGGGGRSRLPETDGRLAVVSSRGGEGSWRKGEELIGGAQLAVRRERGDVERAARVFGPEEVRWAAGTDEPEGEKKVGRRSKGRGEEV